MSAWKLYYDGTCKLCYASKQKAERWARRARQPLDIDVLQSDEAQSKGYKPNTMIVEADDKVFRGADAWIKLTSIGPWYLRWTPLMARSAWGLRTLRRGYAYVARHRFKWFGTRSVEGSKPS